MDEGSDNPFAGILGSNVFAPPSDIASAVQDCSTPGTPACTGERRPHRRAQRRRQQLEQSGARRLCGGAGGALQSANQVAQQHSDNRLKAVQAALDGSFVPKPD